MGSSIGLVEPLGQFFDVLGWPVHDLHPEVQSHLGQYLFDLVKGFAPEIRSPQHLGFGLLHQVADIDDVVVLQAIGGTYRQLQFVDFAQQILVERQLARTNFLRGVSGLFEVYEELELVLQDSGGKRNRVLGRHRTVSLEPDREPVVIGDLTHPRVLDPVGHLAHRAEQRIDRDQANRRVFRSVLGRGDITLATLDGQLHRDLRAVVECADHEFGVHYVDVVTGLDRAGANLAGAVCAQAHAFRLFPVHPQIDALDVEHNVGDVFEHTRDRRELVEHALDLHRGEGRTLQGGQEHTAQGVAEGQPEAALERLGNDRSNALRIISRFNRKLLRLNQRLPVFFNHHSNLSRWMRRSSATQAGRAALLESSFSPTALQRGGCPSDAAPLGRPTAIMRDRRNVPNRRNRKPYRLQGTQRRFPPRARTLDLDVEGTHAVLHGLSAGIFRSDLRRVRG